MGRPELKILAWVGLMSWIGLKIDELEAIKLGTRFGNFIPDPNLFNQFGSSMLLESYDSMRFGWLSIRVIR